MAPLPLGLSEDKIEVSLLRLARGADPNVKDNGDYSPLHTESSKGKLEVVRRLIAHGTDVNELSGQRSSRRKLGGRRVLCHR
jgi:ankyrin repeat protein